MSQPEITHGEIRDIQEFDRCLSAEEVAAIYAAMEPATSGLANHVVRDEASPTDQG